MLSGAYGPFWFAPRPVKTLSMASGASTQEMFPAPPRARRDLQPMTRTSFGPCHEVSAARNSAGCHSHCSAPSANPAHHFHPPAVRCALRALFSGSTLAWQFSPAHGTPHDFPASGELVRFMGGPRGRGGSVPWNGPCLPALRTAGRPKFSTIAANASTDQPHPMTPGDV